MIEPRLRHESGAVAIIGAGPAGCATALALTRRGVAGVVLFDSTRNAESREVIGECIPPAATPLLRELGVLGRVEGGGHLSCPGSKSLWGSPQPGFNDFLFDPVGHGYHLDRRRFDEQLRAAAVEAGVDVRRGQTLRAVREDGDRIELTMSGPDDRHATHRVALAVDASGPRAALARRLGVARNTLDRLIAVNALIEVPRGAFATEHTLVEAVENGWWYAASLPQGRMIVSLYTDPATLAGDALHRPSEWRSAFGRTSLMREEIDVSLVAGVERFVVREAPTTILSAVDGWSWLAVGDAASAYDPIGSAGITKALAHGIAAAGAIEARLEARVKAESFSDYQRTVFADFTTHVKLRRALYSNETRWPDAPFWVRRCGGPPSPPNSNSRYQAPATISS